MAVVLWLVGIMGMIWIIQRVLRLEELEKRIQNLEQQVRALRLGGAGATADSTRTAATSTRQEPVLPIVPGIVASPEVTEVEPSRQIVSNPTPPPPPLPREPVPISERVAAPKVQSNPDAIVRPVLPRMPTIPKTREKPFWTQWIGENPVVHVGLVVFLLGVAFLIRQAAQAGLFPPELRLLSMAVVGTGLLVMGWKWRTERPTFALPIQGGGLGILLFVVYAAFRWYQFLSSGFAFAVVIALLVALGWLAVVQNARSLALMALVSGFAAPLLLSTGSGNYIALFSYYALLNAAIVGIAWFRSWRILHILAFCATYGVASLWGLQDFSASKQLSCELFLWLYYVMFASTAFLFTRREYRNALGFVDGTILFGLPVATLGLQYGIVRGDGTSMALTAAVMAVGNLLVGLWVRREMRAGAQQHLGLYGETNLLLASVLGSVAIPMAFDGAAVAFIWSLEAVGLLYVGLRQNRLWSVCIALLLLLSASFRAIPSETASLWLTTSVGISLWLGAWLLERFGTQKLWLQRLSNPLLTWAFVAVSLMLIVLSDSLIPTRALRLPILLTILTGLVFLSTAVGAVLRWNSAARGLVMLLAVWPFLILVWGLADWSDSQIANLYTQGKYLVWLVMPIVLGSGFWLAHRYQLLPQTVRSVCWAILGYGMLWQGFVLTQKLGIVWSGDWNHVLGAIYLAGLLLVVTRAHILKALENWAGVGFVAKALGPWFLAVLLAGSVGLLQPAHTEPWMYLPFVSPLDLSTFLCAWAACQLPLAFQKTWGIDVWKNRWLPVTFLLVLSIGLNRIFHHYQDVPWEFSALWGNRALHAAWTLLLTGQALGLMWFAHRKAERSLWMTGAVLLGAALLKLFLVDLSGQGTVARIVSFLGMGALMVAIGYFSPLPPRETPPSEQ